jgi:hypothetical protein
MGSVFAEIILRHFVVSPIINLILTALKHYGDPQRQRQWNLHQCPIADGITAISGRLKGNRV